jgi:hypothetical membrane protein
MTDNALKPTAPAIPEATRWLALGAVAGPVLFTLAWFVLGFLSPGFTIFGTVIEPYSPVSQPISGLGLGSTAPFMNAAFVLSGILLMAGVIGVFQTTTASGRPAARWACAALLALSPLGLVIAGIFTLEDPLPHLIGFLLATGTPVLSFLAAGFFLRGMPLAAVRHLATPGQSANAPAGGPLLFDVRSGRHRRWGRSGWANAAHPGRRSPGLVCGHGLAFRRP